MRNKNGFTLVELLAIIVILAVIMVIAVPQILDVVNGSKNSAWKDNVKLFESAIETNSQIFDPETGVAKASVPALCTTPATVSTLAESSDTTVSCEVDGSDYEFTLTGSGQFDGKTATITCTAGGSCDSSI